MFYLESSNSESLFTYARSEEERDTALEKLQDHVWKGKQLRVKVFTFSFEMEVKF